MSEMLIGVLRMSPELFWSDDEMARLQHDNIRRDAADEIERLQAECEKLRKDAERYRWLREGNNEKNSEAMLIAINHYGDVWDEMIDAAMQEPSHD